MNNIKQKALHFLTALMDVYRDEENRELDAFSPMEFSDDVAEDFTAMLLAMKTVFTNITGDDYSDLIDFTHILNKLAVQFVMEKGEDNG